MTEWLKNVEAMANESADINKACAGLVVIVAKDVLQVTGLPALDQCKKLNHEVCTSHSHACHVTPTLNKP